MPIVFKSGSLNRLESSGPVQSCYGIALPPSLCGENVLKVGTYCLSSRVLNRSQRETQTHLHTQLGPRSKHLCYKKFKYFRGK
jgi:hypothetical protein